LMKAVKTNHLFTTNEALIADNAQIRI